MKGILFLATPHQGSGSTQFPSVLTSIANVALSGTSRFARHMRSDLIKALEKDSQILKEISISFRHKASNFHIASFIEQDITPPTKSRVYINSALQIIRRKADKPWQDC